MKCRVDSGVQMKLTQVIFCSLSWIYCPESGALRQWTPVISNWIDWNASWFHWSRTSHKLQFSQLPNQHGTTWAVTSTAQWADCFWERESWRRPVMTQLYKSCVIRTENGSCSYTGCSVTLFIRGWKEWHISKWYLEINQNRLILTGPSWDRPFTNWKLNL